MRGRETGLDHVGNTKRDLQHRTVKTRSCSMTTQSSQNVPAARDILKGSILLSFPLPLGASGLRFIHKTLRCDHNNNKNISCKPWLS